MLNPKEVKCVSRHDTFPCENQQINLFPCSCKYSVFNKPIFALWLYIVLQFKNVGRGVVHILPKLDYWQPLLPSNSAIQVSSKCKASWGNAPKILTPVIHAQNSGKGSGTKGGKPPMTASHAQHLDLVQHHHCPAAVPGWNNKETEKKSLRKSLP